MTALRWLLLLAPLASALAACGPAALTCAAGQMSVCRDTGDCRCGPPCASQDDCTGRDACVFYDVSDSTGTHRSTTGVCVDALWVFNPAPPCVPLCRTDQACVQWNDAPTGCANQCTSGADCRSGCCTTLQDNSRACAPNSTYCHNNCEPPCDDTQVCVLTSRANCAARCMQDSDCAAGCCVGLQGGSGGACINDPAYCPPPNPGPCTVLTSCGHIETTFTASPQAACGLFGSYESAVRNTCQQSIECRGCWWDPNTHAYSICNYLGSIPTNRTVPIGSTQCANDLYPDPPVRIRCVDEYSFSSGYDCLGSTPL